MGALMHCVHLYMYRITYYTHLYYNRYIPFLYSHIRFFLVRPEYYAKYSYGYPPPPPPPIRYEFSPDRWNNYIKSSIYYNGMSPCRRLQVLIFTIVYIIIWIVWNDQCDVSYKFRCNADYVAYCSITLTQRMSAIYFRPLLETTSTFSVVQMYFRKNSEKKAGIFEKRCGARSPSSTTICANLNRIGFTRLFLIKPLNNAKYLYHCHDSWLMRNENRLCSTRSIYYIIDTNVPI